MSEFLAILEDQVQIVALIFMGTVYTTRVLWMFRKFPAGKELTYPVGNSRLGSIYSLMNVGMPWAMESTRKNIIFYAQFLIFHLGVVTTIVATFIIPYLPWLFEIEIVMRFFQICAAAAAVVGFMRLIRRIFNPTIRIISTPDDYFSVTLMTLWFAIGAYAMPNEYMVHEWPLIIFFGLTTVFLVYVPFSKISHYLYYPFIRYYLGKTMGHRSVFPRKKGQTTPAGLEMS